MAGITDLPFRKICLAHGAALATSEMLTSDTSLWESDKSHSRLHIDSHQSSINSIQIAGSEPKQLAYAAQAVVKHGAQIVDINMGCPAKKVCKKLAGSALLKDEILVENILKSVVNAVDVPVTLKTRTGWDKNNRNGINIAKMAEDLGIKALSIHGRTRACRFNGRAEYDSIAEIVNAVNIPVIANGDIDGAQKALDVLNYTNANAVMVGRGAFGNPWIFNQINSALNKRNSIKNSHELNEHFPKNEQIGKLIVQHLSALHQFYGSLKGYRIARKHFAWYLQKHNCFDDFRTKELIQTFNTIEEPETQITFTKNCFNNCPDKEEIAA